MAHSVLDRAWAQASEPYLLACQIFLLAIPPDSQVAQADEDREAPPGEAVCLAEVVPAEAASQDEEGEEAFMGMAA